MTKNERLKSARVRKGITQEELAVLMGVSTAYIGQLETKQTFGVKQAHKLAEFLGVSANWILFGEEGASNVQGINKKEFTPNRLADERTSNYVADRKPSEVKEGTPMYESPSTASEVEVYNDIVGKAPAFYVNIPQFKDCEFGKIIYGHSMYPTYESGSYVFCKKVTDLEVVVPGEIYLIETGSFSIVKRLRMGKTENELIACSDNEELRKDGTRKYEDFPIKKDKIRNLYLVKGCFKQTQN